MIDRWNVDIYARLVQVVDVDDGGSSADSLCGAASGQDGTGRDGSRAPLPQTNGTPPVISLTHTFTLCTPTPRLISLYSTPPLNASATAI